MPELPVPALVLGASPVTAGSGGAGEMLGLQLPGEVMTSVP